VEVRTALRKPGTQDSSKRTVGMGRRGSQDQHGPNVRKMCAKTAQLGRTRQVSVAEIPCYHSKRQIRPTPCQLFGSTRSQVRILSPRFIPAEGLSAILRVLFCGCFWVNARMMCAKAGEKDPIQPRSGPDRRGLDRSRPRRPGSLPERHERSNSALRPPAGAQCLEHTQPTKNAPGETGASTTGLRTLGREPSFRPPPPRAPSARASHRTAQNSNRAPPQERQR